MVKEMDNLNIFEECLEKCRLNNQPVDDRIEYALDQLDLILKELNEREKVGCFINARIKLTINK